LRMEETMSHLLVSNMRTVLRVPCENAYLFGDRGGEHYVTLGMQ